MNYKESTKILEEVKKAERILLSCHKGADPDSIVSCLMSKRAFSQLGIKADIFIPEPLHPFYKHLDSKNEIKLINFDKFDFSKYDLFFIVDVNDLARLNIQKELPKNLQLLTVDHHAGKRIDCFGIRDTSFVCTSEMLFNLFEDWDIKLDKELVMLALIGIASDSDMFNYTTSARLFRTVAKLIDMGANYEEAATLLWRNNSPEQFKFLAKALEKIEVDEKYKFAYSFIPYEDYKKFNEKELIHPARTAADSFLRTVRGTNFGMVMLEYEENQHKISVRSRLRDFVTLPIVESLGGGGHKDGGGAAISNKSFTEASDILLKVARDFAKASK